MTPLNTIIEEEKLEPQVDYILYNLRQSIKHELEGTHIGSYKNDVQKYKVELLNLLATAMQRAYEAGVKERDTYWKERVRGIGVLASESAEYPNGMADGAWVYLGTLKTIIRDITNEDNLK